MLGRPSPWPRRFLAALGWLAGGRVRTIGTPLRDNVLFLANHQSWTDIPILAGATGTAFVAKAELRRVPLIGWLCTLNRTVFVDRSERMAVSEQIDRLREGIAAARRVTIFPEGTTSDSGLLPFKASLLQALDPPPPGLKVQPVLIDYGPATRDVAWVGDELGAEHARHLLGRSGSFPVTLTFLKPFDPRDSGDRKAIAAEARRRMEAAGVQPGVETA